MYVPKNMEMNDLAAIKALISEFGFGTLVSPDLEATRLPLIFETSTSGEQFVVGHMARANPQWKGLSGKRVTVLFNGPHAYISPTWYVSQPAVPTWNYAQVQCFGEFTELNYDDTLSAINKLINKYEPEIAGNLNLMPPEYVGRLARAVVGFRVQIDRIDAKEKLGQHKSDNEQLEVHKALSNSLNVDSVQLAEYMARHGVGTGA